MFPKKTAWDYRRGHYMVAMLVKGKTFEPVDYQSTLAEAIHTMRAFAVAGATAAVYMMGRLHSWERPSG